MKLEKLEGVSVDEHRARVVDNLRQFVEDIDTGKTLDGDPSAFLVLVVDRKGLAFSSRWLGDHFPLIGAMERMKRHILDDFEEGS